MQTIRKFHSCKKPLTGWQGDWETLNQFVLKSNNICVYCSGELYANDGVNTGFGCKTCDWLLVWHRASLAGDSWYYARMAKRNMFEKPAFTDLTDLLNKINLRIMLEKVKPKPADIWSVGPATYTYTYNHNITTTPVRLGSIRTPVITLI